MSHTLLLIAAFALPFLFGSLVCPLCSNFSWHAEQACGKLVIPAVRVLLVVWVLFFLADIAGWVNPEDFSWLHWGEIDLEPDPGDQCSGLQMNPSC